MDIRELANPRNYKVVNHPDYPEPKEGDRVEIIDWSTQRNVSESVKAARLPYLTVSEVKAVVTGEDNHYYWRYLITVKESDLNFIQPEYKILTMETIIRS